MAAEVAPSAMARRLPGVRGLVEGVVMLALFSLSVSPLLDPDFFWHVRVGDWIATHGRVPTQDLFSYTVTGHPWVPHEWLGELTMSRLAAGGALGPVILLFGLVTSAGLVLVYRTAREVPYPIRAAALLLGVMAANPILGPRLQMITFALSALVLLLLRRYRETGSRRWLLALPPVFLIWANLHAGFVLGLVFIGAHLVGELLTPTPRPGGDGPHRRREDARALGGTLLASALVGVLNPSLAAIYSYPLNALTQSSHQRLIDEWQSPNFHLDMYRPLEAMILATLVLLALYPAVRRMGGRAARGIPGLYATDVLLLLGTLDLALHAVRNIPIFAVAATPILATLAGLAWERWGGGLTLREPPRRTAFGLVNLAILIFVGAFTVALVAPRLAQRDDGRIIHARFPAAAVDKLAGDLPPGHVFNAFGWGGYLIYRLPGEPVYVYGEAELMGGVLDEYDRVVTIAPDYRQILDRRGVEWVIYPSGAPLTVVLEGGGDWATLLDDGQAAVLIHRDTTTRAWLARHGLA